MASGYTKAKVIEIKQLPVGIPRINQDFVILDIELPPLKQNEILIEAEWISVDPYLRGRIPFWGIVLSIF